MLTVVKITAAYATDYAEYLNGCSQASELGDYYLKDGERVEAPGRWVTGAETVGADPGRAVDGDQLRALMAVRRPGQDRPLRRVGANGQAVAALDATFSAPKSVSAVWALADPGVREGIEAAHELAIDRAMAYGVGRVAMIRERVGTDTVVHSSAAGMVVTGWRHTTARSVNGQAPDPQLHSHLLLHAAVRRDGELVAIDSRSWLVHRREIAAAYRTELARELTQLGFEIRRGTGRDGRYFELQGVPQELIDRWSSRHHQVQSAIQARLGEKARDLEAEILEHGDSDGQRQRRLDRLRRQRRLPAGEERAVGTQTRARKQPLATHGDLDREWSRTAADLGLDGREVTALQAHGRIEARPPASDREILDRLTEHNSTFSDRDARAAALEASAGLRIQDALDGVARLRQASELLDLADGRQTTRAHRLREQGTVHLAQSLAAGRVSPIPPGLADREAARLDQRLRDQGGGLSAEQREALMLGCSDRQLVLIEGQAGTGKSTVLSAVARAHQAAGRRVIVTSTGALAAQRLASELTRAGVTATPYSTAALQAAVSSSPDLLSAQTTVIHDEAALASTREQHQLLSSVQTARARLIEVGDPRQSQPVGAGGLWPGIEHAARDNDGQVQLTRNLRALDPEDRRDQRLFRDGQTEQALAGYHARGRVILTAEQRQAEDRALEAAHADRQAGRRTVVIAQSSNERLDQLNARAQALRRQHQDLSQESIPVPGRPYSLRVGDPVQIRRSFRHPDHGWITNLDPREG